jgi:hypothetical protein
MSLIINLVGFRYEEFKLLNSINHTLHSYNLPEYKRPHKPNINGELLPSLVWRTSNFTHLQYIYVKLKEGLSLELDEVYDDPEIKLELLNKHRLIGESHLICHGYFYGYYVPIDFKDVKLPSSDLLSLGSSINLRNELLEIASKINFDLEKHIVLDSIPIHEKIPKMLEDDELLSYEENLVLELYVMALASIEYDLVISLSG